VVELAHELRQELDRSPGLPYGDQGDVELPRALGVFEDREGLSVKQSLTYGGRAGRCDSAIRHSAHPRICSS
jgi:hypothetical protein